MTDWKAIQSEYEQGASLRSLATKHGVGKSTIERHAKTGQWDSQAGQRDDLPPSKKEIERQAIQAIFLATFERSANITESCKVAGIDRSTFYDWLEKYETFSLLYNQAKEIANDAVRAEVKRRGMDGVEEPVVSQGQLVYDYDPVIDEITGEQRKDEKGKLMWQRGKMVTVRKYSDTLLIFLAKARMPEFREKQQVEVTGHVDVSGFKELLMQRLARLEENG